MKILFLLHWVVFLLLVSGCASTDKRVSIDTRENVTQEFYVAEPKTPIASVILFAGGKGKVNDIQGSNNFLVRSRELFVGNNLVTVVVKAPSDKQGKDGMLYAFRSSDEHAEDISEVISYLKNKYGLPVWLIGTSRGTESAAEVAIASKNKPDGIVLTASISESNNKGVALTEMRLSEITQPVLVVTHEKDNCWVTPPQGSKRIAGMLTNATPVQLKVFSGGSTPKGKDCKGLSHHGFIGQEKEVVDYISRFISTNL